MIEIDDRYKNKDNDIKVEVLTLEVFFQSLIDKGISLNIPDYQRPYAWEQENVTKLLQTLFKHNDNVESGGINLMGNIFLHEDNKKKYRYNLIDGQQRLTTITLMCHVVDKLIKYIDMEDKTNRGNRSILDNILYTDISNNVKRLTSVSEPAQKLMDEFYDFYKKLSNDNQGNQSDQSDNKYIENYGIIENYFEDPENGFTNENNINKETLLNKTIEAFKTTKIILTQVAANKDAMDVFDIMNSTGLPLSEENIVKTKILSKISPDKREESSNEWDAIFRNQNDGDSKKGQFWANNAKDFFYGYFKIYAVVINSKKTTEKDDNNDFKNNYYNDLGNLDAEGAIKEFNKLIEYAKAYSALTTLDKHDSYFNKIDEIYKFENEEKTAIYNLMRAFHDSGIWVLTPVVLYTFIEKKDQIKPAFKTLLNCMLLNILANKNSSGLNKFIIKIMNAIKGDKIHEIYSIFNNDYIGKENRDKYIEKNFNFTKSNRKAKTIYVALLLHKLQYEEKYSESLVNIVASIAHNSVTLEHIYPEKPNGNYPELNDKGEKNHMGNFLILHGSANSSLGNENFSYKQEKYKNYAKYIPYYEEYIKNQPEWGSKEINYMNDEYKKDFIKFFNPEES
jgi:hypothetical protein